MGCELALDSGIVLLGDQLLQPVRIEADHDLFTHNDGRCGAALVGHHQFAHRAGVATHVAQFVCNASLREEGLRPIAWRSTGLAIEQDALEGHAFSLSEWMLKACCQIQYHRRLSVVGSGWINTLNNSGISCLKRISSAVKSSWTLCKGSSSGMVQ